MADNEKSSNPAFLVGLAENRPPNPPVQSIYYETDTGKRVRYIGNGEWSDIDNVKDM